MGKIKNVLRKAAQKGHAHYKRKQVARKEGKLHKNGEKGLKNASIWVIVFAPPVANLFVGEKS